MLFLLPDSGVMSCGVVCAGGCSVVGGGGGGAVFSAASINLDGAAAPDVAGNTEEP
jgi:hypothetical protein